MNLKDLIIIFDYPEFDQIFTSGIHKSCEIPVNNSYRRVFKDNQGISRISLHTLNYSVILYLTVFIRFSTFQQPLLLILVYIL